MENLTFTSTELKVGLFLSATFLVGFLSYYYKYRNEKVETAQFDYSKQDSTFLSKKPDDAEEKNVEKTVDSKPELLNFSEDKKESNKQKSSVLSEKGININNAGMQELIALPGIGEKTAEKIINLRSKMGGFKRIDDLKKVKGIGKAKLKKISKYIFIE